MAGVTFKDFATSIQQDEKPFNCDICNRGFTVKRTMKRHIAAVHGGIKPFKKCNTCDKVFAHTSSLKRHVTSVHEEEKSFKCVICDASFT